MKKLLTPFFCLIFLSGISAQTKTTYTYAIKGKDTLKLDVYTPNTIKPTDSLPTLLWMHGGGFSVGARDYKDDAALCEYVSKNGYIGISISYRLLRKGTETGFGCNCNKQDKLETFKQAVIDYLDAAAFVVSKAKELHVDTTKLIAGGSSAGAEATANAVFMRAYFADDLVKYQDVVFAGLFSCAGAVLNAEYITKNNAVPSVFFHGTNDMLVPFNIASHHYCSPDKPGYLILEGSLEMVRKLKELETAYYFNMVKGGGHEICAVPFQDLDKVFSFFNQTVVQNQIIQTTLIKSK